MERGRGAYRVMVLGRMGRSLARPGAGLLGADGRQQRGVERPEPGGRAGDLAEDARARTRGCEERMRGAFSSEEGDPRTPA